jgi:hypothetical protein
MVELVAAVEVLNPKEQIKITPNNSNEVLSSNVLFLFIHIPLLECSLELI